MTVWQSCIVIYLSVTLVWIIYDRVKSRRSVGKSGGWVFHLFWWTCWPFIIVFTIGKTYLCQHRTKTSAVVVNENGSLAVDIMDLHYGIEYSLKDILAAAGVGYAGEDTLSLWRSARLLPTSILGTPENILDKVGPPKIGLSRNGERFEIIGDTSKLMWQPAPYKVRLYCSVQGIAA